MKFVLISIIFLLAGCTIYSRDPGISNNPNLLEPQTNIKFSDVPVPGGFKLLTQESYSFEAGGVRVGLLKYHGKADVDQVINFYKEQMAMYNWELLNVVEFGQRLMNFDRESESCIISLSPKGKNITITISVGPKTQRAAQKNRPVK